MDEVTTFVVFSVEIFALCISLHDFARHRGKGGHLGDVETVGRPSNQVRFASREVARSIQRRIEAVLEMR